MKLTKKIEAKQIEQKLNAQSQFRIINFFGDEPQKNEALKTYRQKHQDNYVRLLVSKEMEENDWMSEVEQQNNSFKLVLQGLYEQLVDGKKVVEIVGIEHNPELLSVVESLVLADWLKVELLTMVPGLKIDPHPITIVFNTEQRIDKKLSAFSEWTQAEYLQVEKDKEQLKLLYQP